MIMACSRVKIYKHIALSKRRNKILNAEALQNQNAVVMEKFLITAFHYFGFNVESIQEFCACLVEQIIITPIRLWI